MLAKPGAKNEYLRLFAVNIPVFEEIGDLLSNTSRRPRFDEGLFSTSNDFARQARSSEIDEVPNEIRREFRMRLVGKGTQAIDKSRVFAESRAGNPTGFLWKSRYLILVPGMHDN